ncbi:hypothetical protein JX580_05655 [Thiomicrospira microaerophila]|uniref:hypothetical protein n=1 Tax=Thiomicrospira microaerophila TaxID=406020 RepID=UPI0020108097|nr:hypothetical protein [Thiomicrospira microaerophila]UQB43346.1 hypothetical protein JX580_05655 [Thiomicrospira microaerophila]
MQFVDTFGLDRQQASVRMQASVKNLSISAQRIISLREGLSQELNAWMASPPSEELTPLSMQWRDCFQRQINCSTWQWP